MNLEPTYSAHVRRHLGYFPVWQPGDAVVPGDIGELEHGIFRRQGNLSDIFPQLKVNVGNAAVEGLTRFRSSDCSATTTQASGTVPAHGAVNVDASLKITFGEAGGAVFDAVDCTESYIVNLLEVRTYVEQRRSDWPTKFKLATRITDAKSFFVLIASAAGASVDVTGDAKALGSWNLAHAGVSTANESNVGYERTGHGAILVGLYGFGIFGQRLKVLSATDAMSPEPEFKELPARDPLFD